MTTWTCDWPLKGGQSWGTEPFTLRSDSSPGRQGQSSAVGHQLGLWRIAVCGKNHLCPTWGDRLCVSGVFSASRKRHAQGTGHQEEERKGVFQHTHTHTRLSTSQSFLFLTGQLIHVISLCREFLHKNNKYVLAFFFFRVAPVARGHSQPRD